MCFFLAKCHKHKQNTFKKRKQVWKIWNSIEHKHGGMHGKCFPHEGHTHHHMVFLDYLPWFGVFGTKDKILFTSVQLGSLLESGDLMGK